MTRALANRIFLINFRIQKSEKDCSNGTYGKGYPEREYGRLGLAEPTDCLLGHSQAERFQARIDFRFRRLIRSIGRMSHEMIPRCAVRSLQCFL